MKRQHFRGNYYQGTGKFRNDQSNIQYIITCDRVFLILEDYYPVGEYLLRKVK